MRRNASSYDRNASLPGIGGIFVWEIDKPAARALIEVVDVFWNGEEWWVRTNVLLPDVPDDAAEHLNDVARFWEAVTPVRERHGADMLSRRDRLLAAGDQAASEGNASSSAR